MRLEAMAKIDESVLETLRDRAMALSEDVGLNDYWTDAWWGLAMAADRLLAMMARLDSERGVGTGER